MKILFDLDQMMRIIVSHCNIYNRTSTATEVKNCLLKNADIID